jgi:hypothetical protein
VSEPNEPDEPNGPGEDEAGPAPRRRHGRVRRWVVRPFVWGLLLVVLVLAVAYLFVESQFAHRRAVALVTTRLSTALGRPIQVGSIDYSFAPLAFELHDLVVPGPRAGDPDFARVATLRAEFSWRDLRQRVLRLEQIEVVNPYIYIRFNPDGTTNLPSLQSRRDAPRRFEVQIGRVLVQGGTLQLDETRLPLEIDARTIWGRLIGQAERGGEGGRRLDAQLIAREVVTTLPNARPYPFLLSVQGSYEPGLIKIASARVRGGPHLTADARGRFTWQGKDRRLDLTMAADGSARLANYLGYMEEPIDGPFSFRGRFGLVRQDWRWSGRLRSPRIAVLNRDFRDLEADLLGTRQRLDVDIRRAGYAGGTVAGDVAVQLAGEQGEAGWPVALDLEYQDLALQPLVQDQFPGEDLPLVDELAGRVSGTLQYRFRHREPVAGSGFADVRLSGARTEAGRIPISGRAPLTLRDGVVTSDSIRLTAPGQEIQGTGFVLNLDGGNGRFGYRLASQDVGVLAPLLSEPGEERPFWLPSQGRGTAQGTVELRDGGIRASVVLDLRDAVAPALAADRVSGSFIVSPAAVEDLRLDMAAGGAVLHLTGAVPLEQPGQRPRPLALTLVAERWPVDRLSWFLPEAVSEPGFLGGRVSGLLDLGGTAENLNGRATAEVNGLTVGGFEMGRAQAEVTFAGERIVVEQGVVRSPAGALLIAGSFNGAAEGGGALDFTVDAPALSLDEPPLRDLLGGEIYGRAALGALISGTAERPRATVRLAGRDLGLRGRPLGDAGTAEVLADWDGQALQASGSLLGLVSFEGGGPLTTERADLSFDVRSDRLGTLARLAAPQLADFQGSLLGAAGFTADFGAGTYQGTLRLDDLRLLYEGRTISNLEPVVAALTPRGLEIRSLYMGEAGTESELFVAGTVGLGGETHETVPLDLRVQSTVSAAWIELFAPDLEVAGFLDVLATVRGTLEEPRLNGQGVVRDGRLVLPDFPQQLENISGPIYFNRDRVQLGGVRARLGRGTLTASGFVVLGTPLSYELGVRAENVSFAWEGFLLRGDADLAVEPSGPGRIIRGAIQLDQAAYRSNVETDLFRLLEGALRRERQQVEQVDEALAQTQLNIRIEGDEALLIRNNVADLRGGVELTIRGSLADPAPTGTVFLEPGGKLLYADNEYEIEQAQLTFQNRLDPYIDLRARTEIRNYDIVLGLSGTLERLNPTFSSDAGLADLEVLALLSTGQELQDEGRLLLPGERPESDVRASEFLAGQAAVALSQRVNTLFGFDRFQISPLPPESGRSISGVQVTVGKRVSRDIFVTVTTNPAASSEYIARLEWQVGRNLVLVMTRNEKDNTWAADFEWERRY